MKHRITLYIEGYAADMNDDAAIIYNYKQDDLNNPTIVRNSFSCQMTLPKTDNNARIFGHFGRHDRRTTTGRGTRTGVRFDPTRKTSFQIFAENGEIVESGYIMLDKMNADGYVVTLYGGLGNFFYSLMYDEDGEKRTMADLSYLGGGSDELNYIINAQTITTAWESVRDSEYTGKWKVVNFAPCYNGIPENFDADKLLVKVTDNTGIYPQTAGGVAPRHGYALAQLDERIDEWKARDLRSYLQRPVLSVAAALDAISNPTNNGGWSVNWNVARLWFARNSWVTLPMLTENEDYARTSTLYNIGSYYGVEEVKDNMEFTPKNIIVRPRRAPSGTASVSATFKLSAKNSVLDRETFEAFDVSSRAYCVQIIARSANGGIVAASPVYAFTNATRDASAQEVAERMLSSIRTAEDLNTAQITGESFACVPNSIIEAIAGTYKNGIFTDANGNTEFATTITGAGVDYYEVRYGVADSIPASRVRSLSSVYYTPSGTSSGIEIETQRAVYFACADETITATAIRSGADVTKADILKTEYTPADFLVGLARLMGWYFVADKGAKVINVYDRLNFYTGDVVDLTDSVTDDAETTPLVADTRYYDFQYDESAGYIPQRSEERNGQAYAAIRVDTGYEFDNEPNAIFDGVCFRGAAMLTERNRMYAYPQKGGTNYEGWQLRPQTWTFGDTTGTTANVEVAGIIPNTYSYFNAKGVEFGDSFSKVLLCDEEGKTDEKGAGVLLYLDVNKLQLGVNYRITDDTTEMLYQNGGVPCWLVDNSATRLSSSQIPQFRRAYISNNVNGAFAIVQSSWDIATPMENYDLNFPKQDSSGAIFPTIWGSFVKDRYSRDTRVVRCRVDLSEFIINEALFRKFFIFGGALWVLNSISDYKLGSDDPVTAEFIKVQDKENYI